MRNTQKEKVNLINKTEGKISKSYDSVNYFLALLIYKRYTLHVANIQLVKNIGYTVVKGICLSLGNHHFILTIYFTYT